MSARGFPVASRLHGDDLDFTACMSEPESRLSGTTAGSDSLSRVRLIPVLENCCLRVNKPLRSTGGDTRVLATWKTANIPGGFELPGAGSFTGGADGFDSELRRSFFNGGSLLSDVDAVIRVVFSSRHTSRWGLMVNELKLLKQTGHCTEAGVGAVASDAIIIAANRFMVM